LGGAGIARENHENFLGQLSLIDWFRRLAACGLAFRAGRLGCPLDTRSKIVTADQAREQIGSNPAKWIAGNFDPLLAAHIRHLRDLAVPGHLLVVEITNSEHPLLAQRARAELVAALAMVDFVVLANGSSAAPAPADAVFTERLVEHVLQRHREEKS